MKTADISLTLEEITLLLGSVNDPSIKSKLIKTVENLIEMELPTSLYRLKGKFPFIEISSIIESMNQKGIIKCVPYEVENGSTERTLVVRANWMTINNTKI